MALVHCDSFAHYASAQIADVYPDLIVLSGTISTGAFGRNGEPGMRFTSYEDAAKRISVAPASGAVAIQQCDFRITANPSVANGIIGVFDGATSHCTLAINTDRTLAVYLGDASGTLLGTSSYVVPLNTYIHIGFKVTINDATGSALVHVWEDGDTAAQVVLNLTNKDTKNTANATWNGYSFGGGTSTGNTDFCNLVIMDGSGSSANDLLGPVDVRALFASARLTPSLTDWSLSAGASVSALVDDPTPDDDTTYLEETTQNQQMTVAVDPVPRPSRTILGAELYASVKLTSGSPTLKAIGYQSGSANLGADFSPTASYTYLQQPYSALPDGTAFSTSAVFDALQWGLKLTTSSTGARVTQIVVVVIQARARGKNNLLTGYGHAVTGDENVASGQSNTIIGSTSRVHGANGTVVGDRTFLLNLDGVTRTVTGNGKFNVYGDFLDASSADEGDVLTLVSGAPSWEPPTGGGSPSDVGALTLIEEQTPSGVGTVTFSSLGSYTHLKILWTARSTDNSAISTNINIRFNADTGGNYDYERIQGAATTASAAEALAATSINIATCTANLGSGANMASSGEVVIYDYRGTTFEKNVTAISFAHRTTATNGQLAQTFGGAWRNTAAITSITVFLTAGNYVAGSKLTLYGMQ